MDRYPNLVPVSYPTIAQKKVEENIAATGLAFKEENVTRWGGGWTIYNMDVFKRWLESWIFNTPVRDGAFSVRVMGTGQRGIRSLLKASLNTKRRRIT